MDTSNGNRCPCCGAIRFKPSIFRYGSVPYRIYRYLATNQNRIALRDEIMRDVYNTHDGGPLDISDTISRMNKTLVAHGQKIEGRRGRPGGYQLIELKAAT